MTSTPPVKMSPSARQTSARASEPSTSSMHATSAWNASSLNRLSGGLSRTIDGDVAVALEPDRALGHRSQPSPRISRRPRRSRPGRRRAGSRAASAGRPRSAGSRGRGSGRRSARRRAGRQLRMLKPSGSSISSILRGQPPRGDHRRARGPRRRSPSGRRECLRGITSACPRVAGLMSMKATVCSSESTIWLGTRRRRSRRRGSRLGFHRGGAAYSRAAPIRRRASPRRGSRPRPRTPRPRARRAAGRAPARARSRARRRARRRRPAARGGPSRCQARAAGSISRASSRWASIISGAASGPPPRAARRSATVSRVTSARDRLGQRCR